MAETNTSPAALRALATELALIPPRFRRRPLGEAAATLRALAAEKEAGAPAPAPDGWIPWEGGDCPVIVTARFRSGDEVQGPATGWSWWHDGAASDIIAYRLSKEGTP